MKLLFLGTGAADWKKENYTAHGEFRRNSSALLDDQLLIDPGPWVLDAIAQFGVDMTKIRYILNTHRHNDHYNPRTVAALLRQGAELIYLKAEEDVQLGDYHIRALAVNHGTCAEAVHFLIDDGKSRLFYGLDGAWLMYREVQAIKEQMVDYAVLDATVGFIEGDYRVFEHNNLYMVEQIKKSLEPHVKRFCISHMARTLHTDHQTLANEMDKLGIETAYDGMTVEF
ncbi:MAG: MBL fold metallo-hydrolase [Lachnospiraceae bacterium]|nr:MBL fold metallo-hydrolase [Lachnospiraceae bacterium]